MDTSALVKRYLHENGSRWVRNLVQANENSIHISEITLPEVTAAVAANERAPQGISERLRDRMWDLFLEDCAIRYQLIEVSRQVIDLAVEISKRRKIRGCDAIQLSTAIQLYKTFSEQNLSLTFVAADNDLLLAATAEGLSTFNPETIPDSTQK